MAKRGRPCKYKDISEFRKAMAERQRKYYYENREVILARGKMKRRKAKEQQNKKGEDK